MIRRLALLLAAAAAGAACAAESPVESPHSAPLELQAGQSHYRFALTPEVYRRVARRDLGDLRVLNAQGEAVPHAFAARTPEEAARPVDVRVAKLFPLYGDAAGAGGGFTVRTERRKDGTLVNVLTAGAPPRGASPVVLAYLIDVAAIDAPKEALLLEWGARRNFSGNARIQTSDDLKSWSSLVTQAPVMLLEHEGASLERSRVELGGTRARYLRLSFSGVPGDLALKTVRVELRGEAPQAQREWLAARPAETTGKAGEYPFDAGGHFPVDRVRFGLPQQNTVASIQVLSRARADDPWRPVGRTTAYRLLRDGGEVASEDLALAPDPDRFWMLRVDQKGGGAGSGELQLQLGWLPHEIVFAARGEAPFALAFGDRLATPAALALEIVVPGYRRGVEIPAGTAKLGDVAGPPGPRSVLSDPLGALRAYSRSGEVKTWALWAALVAGVLLVAWMAIRLLREMNSGKS